MTQGPRGWGQQGEKGSSGYIIAFIAPCPSPAEEGAFEQSWGPFILMPGRVFLPGSPC